MYFNSLEIHNFRNYEQLSLELCPGVNIFYGPNGQGKTNLLEAFYFLARGESFRPGKTESFILRKNLAVSRYSTLKANIVKDNLASQLQVSFFENKKKLLINSKSTTSISLVKNFPLVLFSPESLAAVKSGPEQRRALVDEYLVTYDHKNVKLLADFKRCLRQRNKTLKDIKSGRISEVEGMAILESLRPSFLALAAHMTHVRVLALRALEPGLKQAMKFIFSDQNVDIFVDYLASSYHINDWDLAEIHNALSLREKELRRAELESGTSLVGPHKHDIRFIFNGEDARYYCSQGQQRALILSFKMAQIMYHYKVHSVHPFLLLDDVLSELDPDRRKNLIEFLRQIRSQILLTTTEINFPWTFKQRELVAHQIENGQVSI